MKNARRQAFTLIEMGVVLGGIAALAVAVLLPMLRHLDELARQKEGDSLKKLADAYRKRVSVQKIIPNQNGWATSVGTELGLDLNAVTNNARGLRRVFLIDPNLAIGNNSSAALSYTQSINGHIITNASGVAVKPISPRLMLVSSVSGALPGNLVSGIAASSGSNSFNNIWATRDGSLPSGWTWAGRGDDLKVQRIDLTDLFVQVILNNRDTNLVPSYGIDQLAAATVSFGGKKPMFLVRGTEVRLYNAAGTLEYAEILEKSKSFTFEYGTWQSDSYLANAVGQASPIDLQKVMNWFMNSPTNQYAKFGASQIVISNAMVSFLTNYINWRDGSPPYVGQFQGNGQPPAALAAAQANLASVSDNLIKTQ